MKINQIFIVALFLLMAFSCSQKTSSEIAGNNATMQKNPEVAEKSETDTDYKIFDRKLIKEGTIRFETTNAEKTRNDIAKIVSNYSAYIAKDDFYTQGNRTEYNISIRVPADKFESLITQIETNTRKLDSKSVNVADVTSEFIDYEARIKTKKELENRYKELLKQAVKVDEILNIEKEIGILRADIESIEGQLKYLNDKVKYSTFTVIFYEKSNTNFGFAYKMGNALKSGWQNLLWFFVWIVNLWPFVFLAVALVYVKNKIRKRKKVDN